MKAVTYPTLSEEPIELYLRQISGLKPGVNNVIYLVLSYYIIPFP